MQIEITRKDSSIKIVDNVEEIIIGKKSESFEYKKNDQWTSIDLKEISYIKYPSVPRWNVFVKVIDGKGNKNGNRKEY